MFVQDHGKIRHFYSSHPRMSPEIKERGLDLLNLMWNVLDLTPHGRGDFYASLALRHRGPPVKTNLELEKWQPYWPWVSIRLSRISRRCLI